MASGPVTRRINGQEPGWTGHVRHVADETAGATITPSDVTIYDPPLRLLYIGGAGNLSFVCDGDDDAVANHRSTIAVTAGQLISVFAIRQVRAATTATGIQGWR